MNKPGLHVPGARKPWGPRATPEAKLKVALTCDLLRFTLGPEGYRNAQLGNMRWLAAVLGADTRWPQWGVAVRFIEPPGDFDQLRSQVRSATVLEAYRMDPLGAWAARYAGPELDVRPSFADEIADCDLIIGFELPPAMKRVIHLQGKPYISFHIHALRYLSDLCLGAVTNDAALLTLLEQVALHESEPELQARRYVALMSKHAFPALHIPEGWPLLVGQTARDSILIDDGRFADWPDFEDELAESLEPYPGCVLLEHPFRRDSDTVAQYLRARFGTTVVMSNANGYGVLFQNRQMPEVMTLSSSLGVEAQALRLHSRFLLGDPRDRLITQGLDLGSRAPLHHGVLEPGFWKRLLLVNEEAVAMNFGFGLGEDYLRRGIEAWSYGELQHGFAKSRARKVIFPSAALAEADRDALAGSLKGSPEPVQGWDRYTDERFGDGGVELVIAAPPAAFGQAQNVAGGDPWASVVLEGFHAPEPWGSWSAGQECRLWLSVAPAVVAQGGLLEVRLTLQLFEELRALCPVCRISQEEQTLALVFFRPGGPQTLQPTFLARANSTRCPIDLSLSHVGSPRHANGGTDARTLGIGLLSASVAALLPGPAANPAPAIWGVTAQPFPLQPVTEAGA